MGQENVPSSEAKEEHSPDPVCSATVPPLIPAWPPTSHCHPSVPCLQEQLAAAEALKKEGNDLYGRGDCEAALVRWEASALDSWLQASSCAT